MNHLYYGDNLTIMQEMKSQSVDLIYLDPPFNSNQTYNLLYKNMTGKPVPEQAEAFFDTWELDAYKERVARSMPVLMREHGIDDAYVEFWRLWMNALRDTQPHLLAYLIYMTQRLIYMKTLLRPNGSIYLHCDPTASHYIKIMMDGIFGHQNFRNEIIWRRTGSHNSLKTYGSIHDTILFYSKSDRYTFNVQRRPYSLKHVEKRYKIDSAGRAKQITGGNILTGAGVSKGKSGSTWRGFNPTAKNRHWAIPKFINDALPEEVQQTDVIERLEKLYEMGLVEIKEKAAWPHPVRYLQETDGQPCQDIWAYQPYTDGTLYGTNEGIDSDVMWLGPTSPDRLGYPTQKPIGLLKRIISTSTNKGDIVFDPFCGCGTTIYAAHELERNWVGCDIAILSVKLVREVLLEKYRLVEDKEFEISGIPVSEEQAKELFKKDPFQFQHWFVERIGGFPMQKKVADRGIDGRMYFEVGEDLREMVLSVKGGIVRPTDVRDLRGVLEREPNAELAAFLSIKPPTKAMIREAEDAGLFEYKGVAYPRMQFLTVKELLEGKKELKSPTRVGTKISTGQQSIPSD